MKSFQSERAGMGRRHGETVRKAIFEYRTRPEARGFRK